MWQGKRICVSAIALAALLAVLPKAQAQDQPTSVAEAARKAREQKKAAGKEEKVITNDTLEPPKVKPEVTSATATEPAMPGAPAATTEAAATGTATADSKAAKTAEAKADEAAKDEEEKKKELAALKAQIREMKKEVDLAQRALSLANEDYYSHPDYSKDTDGKAKLDQMLSDLGVKKDELAQLLAKLPEGESADEKPAEAPPQQ